MPRLPAANGSFLPKWIALSRQERLTDGIVTLEIMLQTPARKEIAKLLNGVDLDPRCRQLVTSTATLSQSNTALQRIVAGHPTAARAFASGGPASAAAVLCTEALQDLLGRIPLKALEPQEALRRAKACTEVAVRLCDLPIEIPALAVVGACTWLDAGKALLDALAEAPSAPQPDPPGPNAALALEAETEAYGADHALAGKWLAEHWGLPVAMAEAIWFHHHTLSTVEVAADHPRLCYFVALADALAEFRLSGAAPQATPWIETLCGRLGLRTKEALAAGRPSERGKAEHTPEAAVATAPAPSGAEARYRALCTMHERLHAADSTDAALLALAGGLFEAFQCPAGLCSAVDGHVAWEQSSPKLVDAPPAEPILHGTALPVVHRGQRLGEVVLRLPEDDAVPLSAQLVEISRAVESAGAVLGRIADAQRAAGRAETLGTALHRAEAQRQRGLQAERLAGLARFAAGAAHEINNPLAVISGRAQLLLSQATAPEQQRSLDTIVQQSRRISKIVSDLMQFARPPEPKWALTGMQHLLHQLVGSMRERLHQKHIVIEEHYADTLPRVRIDRHQIEQALMHGLLNAEHAVEARGGVISLEVRAVGGRIEIRIGDNGPGIPEGDLARVFDPFFTTKQFHEGSTGLGLTVARSVIEAHEGTVSLASRVGEGTTLTITLPAAEAASAAPPPVETPADVETAPTADAGGPTAMEAELGIVMPRPEIVMPQPEMAERAAAPVVSEVPTPSVHSIHEASPAPALSASQTEAIIDRVFPKPGAPAAPRAAGPVMGSLPAHGDARVLVIEENEDLREVLRAALASHGHEVETAPDGLEGLASALAHPPALILSSTQLTGVDVVTLVRQIRQRYAALPIIVLGGPGADDLAPEALQAGARALLHKPFDFERLLHEITPYLAAKNVA